MSVQCILRDDVLAWGRVDRLSHHVVTPAFKDQAQALVPALPADARWLPRGQGRSYGDSGLNADGWLIDTQGLDRFIAFDPASGILECEAGVTLADILQLLEAHAAAPGEHPLWFLPVTPGTKFVSIGGAIANDVHGKNHHRQGCFGSHVLSLTLLRSSGEVLTCSPQQNAGLFAATLGGLGLTGLVLTARIALMQVPGLSVEVEEVRYDDLDAFQRLADEGRDDWQYDVAWIDCMAVGAKLGRGVFTRARHVTQPLSRRSDAHEPRLSLPVELPEFAMNRHTIGAFNALLWHRAPARPKRQIAHFDRVFYPLDAIAHWNRLYGRRGFYQFQCVIPSATAQTAIRALLQSIAVGGDGSFLGVLKTFGDRPSPGLLSFPMPGTTLALDFPNRGERTLKLLDRLAAISREAGGRIYPAKDGCMSAEDFQYGYPRWREFEPYIDPHCSSSFWRRVSVHRP